MQKGFQDFSKLMADSKQMVERELDKDDRDKSRDLGREVTLEDNIKFNYQALPQNSHWCYWQDKRLG